MAIETTELGKELRKLRIDHGERMLDMANKVGKSAAFLSAVEVGRKPPPRDFVQQIVDAYKLTGEAAQRLFQAMDRSLEYFRINAPTPIARDTAALLARRFEKLSPAEFEAIQHILKKSNGE
jgi:Predicted transcriptional regulator